jgi:tetratricopeptide (TPR) repeat protein
LSIFAPRALAQEQQSEWQIQVRKYCDANDWPAALRVVDQRIAQAPDDLDLKAWHARVLGWSGNLAQAQQEYLQILSVSPNDPDFWAGLGSVYARQGKDDDALLALGRAVQSIPNAPICASRTREPCVKQRSGMPLSQSLRPLPGLTPAARKRNTLLKPVAVFRLASCALATKPTSSTILRPIRPAGRT